MRALLMSASLIALIPFGPAFAQNTTQPASPEVDETIIVTAPGRTRSSAELIANTTAVNRAELVQTLASTLGDTLDRQPGVASSSFGQGASRPILRGLGAERVLVLTNGIGVIDASAASPDHQVTADGIDSVRVEIVRGPAALAYGGQAIGGVVNVLDGLIGGKQSNELLAAHNSVSDGTELGVRLSSRIGPVTLNATWSERALGDYEIPGFAESARLIASEGEEHDAEEAIKDLLPNSFVDTNTAGLGLTWAFDGGYVGIARREQSATYGLPGHSHEHEDEALSTLGAGDEEEEVVFIQLDQTRTELRGRFDVGLSGITQLNFSAVDVDYVHVEVEGDEVGTVFASDGWEVQADAITSFGAWSGAIGASARDSSLVAVGAESFLTGTETSSQGIYVFQHREWDGVVGIEGGLRLERVEIVNDGGGTREFTPFSLAVGGHRHMSDAWFIGAQVALTERAPKEFELFANGPHLANEQYEVGDRDLKAERGLSFEVTARYTQNAVALNTSLYAIDFKDFIFLAPGEVIIGGNAFDEVDDLPVFQFNQSHAQFVGGEISADWTLASPIWGADWTVGAGLDWVSGSLDDGGDVPFLPPVTLNLDVTADWARLRLGANVTLAGEQSNAGEGYFGTDGYTTLDLSASWALTDNGQSRLFVDVRNVTDEEVRLSTSVLKDLVPMPGRNLRAGIRLVF